MYTVLIVGVSGNFGWYAAQAALAMGDKVVGISRADASIEHGNYRHICADLRRFSALEAEISRADLVVYAANPQYHRWTLDALDMLECVLVPCERHQKQILFPGNVYNFAPEIGVINEHSPQQPITEKGCVRVEMEARLRLASESGARVCICRGGDFFAKAGTQLWSQAILSVQGNRIRYQNPGPSEHRHLWSYLPDFAHNSLMLAKMQSEKWCVFQVSGLQLSAHDWAQLAEKKQWALRITGFAWWPLRIIGFVVPKLAEVYKMRYLWQNDIALDDRLAQLVLGSDYRSTPTAEIFDRLIEGLAE
ncbi:MAG: epimerase [Gammaproteobacteria bacterium]|nr:epimerase [Gammaproteobacteria bacterium]